MIALISSGAFWFGIVIGYITYRTLRHKKETGISDIASVIGSVGGAAIVALFPVGGGFDFYAIGLAAGFFLYLLLSVLLAGDKKTAEFLGDE
jgi:hypothetical protein